MWFIFVILMIVAAVVHARFTPRCTRARQAELCLVYLLAGVCGIAQIATGFALLFAGQWSAAHMHVPPGNPEQIWMAFLFIGMGAIGTLTIWLRDRCLIAPAVGWAIFFAGATYAHINATAIAGHPPTLHSVLGVFLSHGLTSLLLIIFLLVFALGRDQLAQQEGR